MVAYEVKKCQHISFSTDLDVGEAWTLDSDDELSCYGDDLNGVPGINFNDGATSKEPDDVVTLQVDRKSSTGSQVHIYSYCANDLIKQS